jgi:hypothetical protein
MRPITKKILESGLLDKHVAAMLARWGAIDQEEYNNPSSRKQFETKEQLERFAEELDELIDKENEIMRETPLDMPLSGELLRFMTQGMAGQAFQGRWDQMGHLIVPPNVSLHRGVVFTDMAVLKKYRVADVTKLYKGEEVLAQCVMVE